MAEEGRETLDFGSIKEEQVSSLFRSHTKPFVTTAEPYVA
jgi:hypothetical protein